MGRGLPDREQSRAGRGLEEGEDSVLRFLLHFRVEMGRSGCTGKCEDSRVGRGTCGQEEVSQGDHGTDGERRGPGTLENS